MKRLSLLVSPWSDRMSCKALDRTLFSIKPYMLSQCQANLRLLLIPRALIQEVVLSPTGRVVVI